MSIKTQNHFYNFNTPSNNRYKNFNNRYNDFTSSSFRKSNLFNSTNLSLKTGTKFFLKTQAKTDFLPKANTTTKKFNQTQNNLRNSNTKSKTKNKFYLSNINYFDNNPNNKESGTILPKINQSQKIKRSPQKKTIIKEINQLDLILNEHYNLYQPAKHSIKSFDSIISYGVNTYRGIIRNYNEDRVSIIVNAKNPNPNKNKEWPNISFFAIYDGHAGDKCSEYLKNHLHNYIFKNDFFPEDPIKSIQIGFKNCENGFIQTITSSRNSYSDFSGSCAIIIIIIDKNVYCVNLGDSRAIYSYDKGNKYYQLSRDQKPNDPIEKKRIIKGGGSVFKTQIEQGFGLRNIRESDLGFKLPYRILPGRLSVARAFGDVEAKMHIYGGNPNVLISDPCITNFTIDDKSDFILIGCDGIYDRLDTYEILNLIWGFKNKNNVINNIHDYSGKITDAVMKYSLKKMTSDNITVIFIVFDNFKNAMEDSDFQFEKSTKMFTLMGPEIDLSHKN